MLPSCIVHVVLMRMHFVMPGNKASYQVTLCSQETQLVQVVPAGTARLASHNAQATISRMASVVVYNFIRWFLPWVCMHK